MVTISMSYTTGEDRVCTRTHTLSYCKLATFLTENAGKFLIPHTQGGHQYRTRPGIMSLNQNVHRNLETTVSCLIQAECGFCKETQTLFRPTYIMLQV